MKNTIEYVRQICIKREKEIDSAIFMEIKDIAIENGIKTEYVLNEKAIINALEKQIPKKPTPHKVEPIEAPIKIGNANWGKGTTIYKCPNCNEFISRTYDYCYKCGQALDWSDTE